MSYPELLIMQEFYKEQQRFEESHPNIDTKQPQHLFAWLSRMIKRLASNPYDTAPRRRSA